MTFEVGRRPQDSALVTQSSDGSTTVDSRHTETTITADVFQRLLDVTTCRQSGQGNRLSS